MPVGFTSAPRNLFLLGSVGSDTVTNFFKSVDQSTLTDGVWLPNGIRYNSSDQKYILSGTASDSNSQQFGWLEKRNYDGETGNSTADFQARFQTSTNSIINTTLRDIELDGNDKLIVVGKSGTSPWIAKYTNNGAIDWISGTNTGEVEYTGITSDSNGKYYACGSSPSGSLTDRTAFVEAFDASGNPSWGKTAYMVGKDVVLNRIAANSRGEVVAVGHLEDDSKVKGYIVKIDTNTGEVMWDRTLENNIIESAVNRPTLCEDVYIDTNDNIYVVGRLFNVSTCIGFIAKYTAEGNMLWQRQTSGTKNTEFYAVNANGETGDSIVFGSYFDNALNDRFGIITKYRSNGDIAWRRTLKSTEDNSDTFGQAGGQGVAMDADPSFIYLLFVDQAISGLSGTPDKYTFGKVSSSGNGLGGFTYTDGSGESLDYEINDLEDQVGQLYDGSVRNDTSDLVTYPYRANKIMFDDLATPVANKRRQMDDKDSFDYSGSPAVRVVDFQEINLLGEFDATEAVAETYEQPTGGSSNDGSALFTRSTITYSTDLSASTLKTPTGGFTPVFNYVNAGDRSEGVGGLTFTPTGGIPYTTSVRVRDNNNVTHSKVNNGSFVQHTTNGWVTVASGSGTINTMFFQRTDNAQWDAGFTAIEVDGYILFDGMADPNDEVQTWTCPAGVTSVSVVCVGAGGAGGGALAYKNNISVTAGANYSVTVGKAGYNLGGAGSNSGTSGGLSQFVAAAGTVAAEGGVTGSQTQASPAGTYNGGGKGGYAYNGGGYGGGGAGGYSGDGGDSEIGYTVAAAGGAGGPGSWAYNAGGGVGLIGEGPTGGDNQGGSYGGDGQGEGTQNASSVTGGTYGGGFSGRWEGNLGGPGAVKIIWPGDTRQFPSTNTIGSGDSLTWSKFVTNGSTTSGKTPDKAFNGSIANNTGYDENNWTRSASDGNTPATFDVSNIGFLSDVTEVKVYAYVADSQNNGTILAVNDVNQATSGQSGFQVYTVDVTGTGLETIKYKYVSGSGPYCYLTGVTVKFGSGGHQELIDGQALNVPAGNQNTKTVSYNLGNQRENDFRQAQTDTGISGFTKLEIVTTYSWSGGNGGNLSQITRLRDSNNSVIQSASGSGTSGTITLIAEGLDTNETYNLHQQSVSSNSTGYHNITASGSTTWNGFIGVEGSSGVWKDQSGKGNDATITTPTIGLDGPTASANGYWEFDGTDDSMIIGTLGYDYSKLITLEAWVYPEGSSGNWNQIVCGEAGDVLWAIDPVNRLNFGSQTNTPIPHDHPSGDAIPMSAWIHLMTTYDGAKVKHYINGKFNAEYNQTGSLNHNEGTHPIRIGSRGTGTGEFFNGKIGEVRIYPRALTEAQAYQNYNASKPKYLNLAPDVGAKVGGVVSDSNLILNYDFGNRACYDDTQNHLLDNFAGGTETGEYLTDSNGKHKIYEKNTNINSAYGGTVGFFSAGTYDVSVSMWMKASDMQTNQFALKNGLGAPVASTYNFTPKDLNPDGGFITHTWTNVTISDGWNFGVYNNNGDARTMQYAKPQLTLKPSLGRYVKAYNDEIAAPTIIKNLANNFSSAQAIATPVEATFNSDGYFELNNTDSVINLGLAQDCSGPNVTFEMWFYPKTTAQSDSKSIILSANYEGAAWQDGTVLLRYDQEPFGTARMFIAQLTTGSTNEFWQHSTQYPRDNWYHVVWTWNNGTMKLYVNGSEKTLDNNTGGPASGTILDNVGEIYIGENDTFGSTVIGNYAQVRIYTKTLSATEVSENFNATRGKYGV